MENPQVDVRALAKLARLELTDEEAALFQSQLSSIISHFATLANVDVTHVEPMTHVLPISNIMRPDQIMPSLRQEEVLASAPATSDGFLVVPPVMEE